MKTCYMCDRPQTSKEHIPPECFFLTKDELGPGLNLKMDLITVPSCDEHNSRKSADDEVLLAAVSGSTYINALGKRVIPRVLRAIQYRPYLASTFYPNLTVVRNKTQAVPAFSVDRERFDREVDHMMRALYYHEYGREKWVLPILIHSGALFSIGAEESMKINREMQRIESEIKELFTHKTRKGKNQGIFYYQIYRASDKSRLVVRMVFYQGFTVTGISVDENAQAGRRSFLILP